MAPLPDKYTNNIQEWLCLMHVQLAELALYQDQEGAEQLGGGGNTQFTGISVSVIYK